MENPIVQWLVKIVIGLLKENIDNNWDGIVDAVARKCMSKDLDPDDNTDSALRTIADSFADYVRESNVIEKIPFLDLSESEAYFMVLKYGNVNWASRVQKRVRASRVD